MTDGILEKLGIKTNKSKRVGITGKGMVMLGIDNMIDSVEGCSTDTLDHIENIFGGIILGLSDKSLDESIVDYVKEYGNLSNKFKKNCICSKR